METDGFGATRVALGQIVPQEDQAIIKVHLGGVRDRGKSGEDRGLGKVEGYPHDGGVAMEVNLLHLESVTLQPLFGQSLRITPGWGIREGEPQALVAAGQDP